MIYSWWTCSRQWFTPPSWVNIALKSSQKCDYRGDCLSGSCLLLDRLKLWVSKHKSLAPQKLWDVNGTNLHEGPLLAAAHKELQTGRTTPAHGLSSRAEAWTRPHVQGDLCAEDPGRQSLTSLRAGGGGQIEINSPQINKLGCCTVEMPLRQYQRCFLRPYLFSSDCLFSSMAGFCSWSESEGETSQHLSELGIHDSFVLGFPVVQQFCWNINVQTVTVLSCVFVSSINTKFPRNVGYFVFNFCLNWFPDFHILIKFKCPISSGCFQKHGYGDMNKLKK